MLTKWNKGKRFLEKYEMERLMSSTHFYYCGNHIKASDDQEQWRNDDKREKWVANHTQDLAVGDLEMTEHRMWGEVAAK